VAVPVLVEAGVRLGMNVGMVVSVGEAVGEGGRTEGVNDGDGCSTVGLKSTGETGRGKAEQPDNSKPRSTNMPDRMVTIFFSEILPGRGCPGQPGAGYRRQHRSRAPGALKQFPARNRLLQVP
jgi:hypothetical protein